MGDVPRHSGEESDAVLGGGDGVGGGGVDDEAAVLGGGGEVDVVDADAGAADDLKAAGGGLEDLAADLGAAPDDEGVAEGDLCAELLGAEVVGAVDVREAAEEIEPGLSQLLGYEDRRLRVHGEGYERGTTAKGAAWSRSEAEPRRERDEM